MKITEDIRAFKEFHPDPVQRHRVHSTFAHRFVPQYVQQNPYAFLACQFEDGKPAGPTDATRFIQSRWSMIYEDVAGLVPTVRATYFRRVSDLSMSVHAIAGMPTALIRMPVPEQPPEAFFIGVTLLVEFDKPKEWSRQAEARVFTLECTPGRDLSVGMFCEWCKDSFHRNFDMFVRSDVISFIGAMKSLLMG